MDVMFGWRSLNGVRSAGALVAASCRWEFDAVTGAVERESVMRARRREARGCGTAEGLLSEGWSACGLPFLQSPDIDSNTSQPPPLFAGWLIILWPGTVPIVTSRFFRSVVVKLAVSDQSVSTIDLQRRIVVAERRCVSHTTGERFHPQ